MKKLMICLIAGLIVTAGIAQDEFFTPGYSIGGYGELHWNQEFEIEGEESKNQLDFHRFIIYYGYNWTDKWSFKSEVELEHNFVNDGEGELELEQAFVNYHAGRWGFQGGVILPSVGLINEYHEPPLFLSVERQDYNKYIIPTTWFGNGFAFYGNYNEFNFRLALLEDLNGDDISDGIRPGRGKGYKTTAENWTKNLSAHFSGIAGLRLGGSLTLNNAPTSGTDALAAIDAYTEYIQEYNDSTETWETVVIEHEAVAAIEAVDGIPVGVTLTEFHAKYNANNIYTVFEYGKVSYTDNPSGYKSSSGYYLDLGYNIASMLNCDGTIMPWVRFSNVTRADGVDDKTYDILKAGLTWKPIQNVAFKLDYGTVTKKSDPENPTTQLNMGIGYNF